MRAAAVAEQERAERELGRLRKREQELTQALELVQAQHQALEDQLIVLRRFARGSGESEGHSSAHDGQRRLRVVHHEPQDISDGGELLRGAQIRETAVRVLNATPQPDQAVHYRTWFELLRREGYVPAGKDPLATFLTQIARSPLVQRSTAAGMYSLDLQAPRRERARIEELQTRLRAASTTPAGATLDEIGRIRAHRTKLTSEVASAERRFAEMLRSVDAPAR